MLKKIFNRKNEQTVNPSPSSGEPNQKTNRWGGRTITSSPTQKKIAKGMENNFSLQKNINERTKTIHEMQETINSCQENKELSKDKIKKNSQIKQEVLDEINEIDFLINLTKK